MIVKSYIYVYGRHDPSAEFELREQGVFIADQINFICSPLFYFLLYNESMICLFVSAWYFFLYISIVVSKENKGSVTHLN